MVGTAISATPSTRAMLPSGAMSALFMATIMGLETSRMRVASASMVSSVHLVGSSGGFTSLTAVFTCASVMLRPARRS